MTARFASTYEKYLNGNGEDVAGLIPTYQQLLDGNDTVLGLKQAHQAMLYGGAKRVNRWDCLQCGSNWSMS